MIITLQNNLTYKFEFIGLLGFILSQEGILRKNRHGGLLRCACQMSYECRTVAAGVVFGDGLQQADTGGFVDIFAV